MMITMPKPCQDVLEKFNQAGHSAYLVGGCVRDSLLGETPSDWDICTSALPEETLALFAGCRIVLTGLQHGTVTLLLGGMAIEVTTYRIDGEYLDNRRPKEVFFTDDLQADLSRRDFTINALAYNPSQGLIDYFGGVVDLQDHLVRAVGDAESRYHEDGLRILRAIRFACVLDFAYEPKTRQAISQCNYLLRNIAMERVQVELNKILLSTHVEQGLMDLYQLGCFAYFIPEMCHLYGFEQHNPYHCYDVFGHTIKSVAVIEPDLILRLTMLLHDVGKPYVWCTCYGESDCFPEHEQYSATLAAQILARLHYDKRTQREVAKLVRYHTYQLEENPESIRQALSIMGEQSLRRLLKVKVADLFAQRHVYTELTGLKEKFAAIERMMDAILARGECYTLGQLAINGCDLMAHGYQGAAIGDLLAQLLEMVLVNPEMNQREILLAQLSQ